ncbi:MAG: class I SAM-dependent methyltransferase [Chloroherpetonaceae bacterium]|nr:class I SAM-dependent methyltransferase [Chloroherpetonaceae bacterium]MDW8437625.1 class I SAM-dependent methyltransferase [Chloroherpetonaceae bacterium]
MGLETHLASYRHFSEYKNALNALNAYLQSVLSVDSPRVLEAGCGSISHLKLNNPNATGIDISQHQLERNQHLAERICADLHSYDNPEWSEAFDLVVCWDVLEHLSNPKIVVEKFFRWAKPTGKIVLAYPNPQTLKGVVTKYSPYFVHQLFYRVASGTPFSASKTDQGPFRTVFAPELRLLKMLELIESRGFKVEWMASAESYQNKFVKRFAPSAYIDALNEAFMGETKSLLDVSASDFIMVISRETRP